MSNRKCVFELKNITVNLIEGDIAAVKAGALVTAINSGRMWYGGIDSVIQRAANQMFHRQAIACPSLSHGKTIIAKKQGDHRGQFGDVVFVIDDLEGPLNKVILAALIAASDAGYTTISLPAIRTGVMLGTVEKNAAEAAQQTVTGLKAFAASNTGPLTLVTLVVYNQPDVFDALTFYLRQG